MSRDLNQCEGIGGRLVDFMIRGSVRRDFRGVYWTPPAAPVPEPCILVANHHGWHDGYVLYLAATKLRLPFVMWVAEYRSFPLFGKAGAIDFDPARQEVRVAAMRRTIRLLSRKERNLILFPEGTLHRPPDLLPFERSLEFLCRKVANVTVVPVGIHYELSMHERPECHIAFGSPMAPGADVLKQSREAVEDLLESTRKRLKDESRAFELLHRGTLDVNERWGR